MFIRVQTTSKESEIYLKQIIKNLGQNCMDKFSNINKQIKN